MKITTYTALLRLRPGPWTQTSPLERRDRRPLVLTWGLHTLLTKEPDSTSWKKTHGNVSPAAAPPEGTRRAGNFKAQQDCLNLGLLVPFSIKRLRFSGNLSAHYGCTPPDRAPLTAASESGHLQLWGPRTRPVCHAAAGGGQGPSRRPRVWVAAEVKDQRSAELLSATGKRPDCTQEAHPKSRRLASNLGPHLAEQLLLLQAQPLLLHLQLLEPHLLLLAGAATAQDAPGRALWGQGRGLLHRGALADSLVHGCNETKHLSWTTGTN